MVREPLTLFKIGGNVVDNPAALDHFISHFVCATPGHKVVVHGGGVKAGQLAEQLGIPVRMQEGRRLTDLATLDVVTMVYAGLINKQLVAKLGQNGLTAIGLSGADGALMTSTQRPAHPVDYGFVGDLKPEGIQTALLVRLLHLPAVPVLCSITCTAQGQLLNTNADNVALCVAVALSQHFSTRLVYVFDKEGVLYPQATEPIPLLSYKQFMHMKEVGQVKDGMIPKLETAFHALRQGVESVSVGKTVIQL